MYRSIDDCRYTWDITQIQVFTFTSSRLLNSVEKNQSVNQARFFSSSRWNVK